MAKAAQCDERGQRHDQLWFVAPVLIVSKRVRQRDTRRLLGREARLCLRTAWVCLQRKRPLCCEHLQEEGQLATKTLHHAPTQGIDPITGDHVVE